jgi:hypothetical protein
MGKSVKKARKETEELRSSVRGMLKDRIKRGLPIPKSGRKLAHSGPDLDSKGIRKHLKKKKGKGLDF